MPAACGEPQSILPQLSRQDHASEQKSPEELVVARAATHGMHWRPGHIQYRNSILRWSLLQRAASIRVREGGSLSSVHLETSVECSSQLSGTPVLSCTFTGAHFMAENGRFHDCVSERRPSAEHGNLSIYAIPPDGNFELVRYTSEAQVPLAVAHTGDHYAGDALVSGNDSNALAVLTQTRLPIAVFAFSNEKQEGRLFDLHVRMRITEEYTLLRQVRCIVPLHPNCRPGSVRITASLGRAQVEWVGDGKATGKHHSVVSWEIETVGTLTGHTEEHERIECNQEATLDIECAIAAPFIVFPHHVITGEENRPACVPEDSLREDRGLWQQWNDIIKNLHKLDEQKKPFPRDRTSSKLQQRQHIEQLKHLAESRLVSSCLSRALPPISVRCVRCAISVRCAWLSSARAPAFMTCT